jgi:hypothetical protein
VADDDVEFIDITPLAGDGEDVLVFGPRRRPPSRAAQTAGVVLGLLGLIVGVLWAGFGTHEATQSAFSVRVPRSATGAGAGAEPSWHTIPITLVPTYMQGMRSLDNGDLLVAGTPAELPPALATAFGPVTGVHVQTVIAPANGSSSRFVCRLTTARSGAFRIQVLAVRRAGGGCSLGLHALSAPGSAFSFTESARAGYDIQVSVSGPNPMSLMRFNGDPGLLDGLISTT